ncbi:hypothetical protein ABI59_22270 [Acidobacteria bacterium Mor1]|nr:hypothetical protein ABI59_22270 [Acidobacteria bacterium Mor1]
MLLQVFEMINNPNNAKQLELGTWVLALVTNELHFVSDDVETYIEDQIGADGELNPNHVREALVEWRTSIYSPWAWERDKGR